ncbi:MAG TPA: ParA family protein [Thermodesulfobacteriota bacterium]
MTRILAIANQKGGVGKTTTAVNLGASLGVAEKRTLLVDLDPQANASSGVGVARDEVRQSVYQVLMGQVPLREVIRRTESPHLDLAPATIDLIGAEVELVDMAARESRLAKALAPVLADYAFVVIDCPPSLGHLTLNALCAAHGVLIPLQCEYYAMEGLSSLLSTVEHVRASYNPGLEIAGILLTMFDPRNRLALQVADEVRRHFGDRVFRTIIPRNVRLAESPSHGKPVLLYDIASKGATSYLELAKEILANGRD